VPNPRRARLNTTPLPQKKNEVLFKKKNVVLSKSPSEYNPPPKKKQGNCGTLTPKETYNMSKEVYESGLLHKKKY
jgi:hypothetical protein